MSNTPESGAAEPARDEVDAMTGEVLLEFGTTWCGHCIAARPLVARALASRPQVRHVRIEDGRGRRLGRSFRVKLWPTLVHLRDGVEVGRAVRPTAAREIDALFDGVASTTSPQPARPHSAA